jgi:hypothetical protein
MTATIPERVAAGAAFLDEHDPGWWRADVERAIDLGTLNLGMSDRCILGQRCPVETLGKYLRARHGMQVTEVWDAEDYNYWALAYELSGIPESGDPDSLDVVRWSFALGFNSRPDNLDYQELTAEWTRVITERRSAS